MFPQEGVRIVRVAKKFITLPKTKIAPEDSIPQKERLVSLCHHVFQGFFT